MVVVFADCGVYLCNFFRFSPDLHNLKKSSILPRTGLYRFQFKINLNNTFFNVIYSFFAANLPPVYKQINKLWPNSFANYPRLYALGVDAYNLASKLNAFLNSAQYKLGASGQLYLDRFNHIYRQLEWAKMQNGKPVILP